MRRAFCFVLLFTVLLLHFRMMYGETNFNYIATSQIGYAPAMKKQFTSPVNFTSFTVVRTSDNSVAFAGGLPVGSRSSAYIGNSAVYIGDFSSFTTPGIYKIVAGGKESLPFAIGSNVFDGPVRAAQRFFYYQRAFTEISPEYTEGPWVHPSDLDKAPDGVVKGWHDAGDFSVYNATMTQTLFWLLETWSDFRPLGDNTNIPESGNGIPDLLDETRWGLEWILSMQDANGGVWMNAVVANGQATYPTYGMATPNNVEKYGKTVPPCVQATAKAVAVLAYAAVVYNEFAQTQAFATTCLAAAQRGWDWIVANPTAIDDGSNTAGSMYNVYAEVNDETLIRTNKMWAAAAMLYATGDLTYEAAFQSFYTPIIGISSYGRSDAFADRIYLRCTTPPANLATQNTIKQLFLQHADAARTDGNQHPFQWASFYYWGSNSNGAHRTGEFSWYAYITDPTRTADRDQLLDNVHYMFGRNYMNLSYMSGSDAFGATQWRKEGFHNWMKTLHATPWHFPGAFGNGPNDAPSRFDKSYPNMTPYPIYGYNGDPRYVRDRSTVIDGRFTDNDSWSTNEIVISWQAAILYNLFAAQRVANGDGGPPDLDSPVITNVQIGNITSSGATITWETNETSSSVVEYGTTDTYGSTANSGGFALNHSVAMSGLTGNTTYFYRVKSSDAFGNNAVSDGHSFGTGVSASYRPDSTNILQGTLASGTFADLATNNGSYFGVASTGSGSRRIADWYGIATIGETPTSIARLTITFDSKYSRANTWQVLSLYNWNTSSWTQIDLRQVGTTDVLISIAQTSPASFISSIVGSLGQIRLRVAINESNSRTCSADFMQFTVETDGAALSKKGSEEAEVQSSPSNFRLDQNYPNPFNPTTTLSYDLPEAAFVSLKVYDLLGREVSTLVDGEQQTEGRHQYSFDASSLASGVYLYKLNAGRFSAVKKMVVEK